ncbi:hypothetical protein Pint_23555 [Pistacia integerrima]|uniref:Uncharacterized protein n=1 Tax=Pistacia integerrima TaxID=434235 RepID=A0ACC0YN56_9ROSI|nr:hypothetical protein Pint_23555 [Pistacia integerrima]
MDEHSAQEQLLLVLPSVNLEKKCFFLSSLKWILTIVTWLIFITWVVLAFLFPLNLTYEFILSATSFSSGTFLGLEGPVFLLFSGPILLIAFFSIPYLIISGKDQKVQEKKAPSYRLCTFPLLVDGPLGVVSAAEFIGILLFAVYVVWCIYIYAIQNLSSVKDESPFTTTTQKICYILDIWGFSLAQIGIILLAFLFIPIARGSILLRLIDIPFGHAARYHVWLGHLTMLFFTLHGLCYVIEWSLQGDLLKKMLEWQESDTANLAGVIGLTAGLLMWITSLPFVRTKYFEVFFYTHQLYIIFVIFLALHVGVIFFSIVAGTIFLYMLDRFLRFCQSRKTVDIVSATCFPGGIVELVLSKPQSLHCDALSFIFLRVREASLLQWHPFSVSSVSGTGEHQFSILIKTFGEWTQNIEENISNFSAVIELYQDGINLQSPFRMITASVEGPYGHELPHHLMYEKLVLVAGGIGISPFLAVLSDIFHRKRQGKPCLVKNILVVWAVKTSNHLSLLSLINRNFSNIEVNLDILIYVTQQSQPPLDEEEGRLVEFKATNSFVSPVYKGKTMSVLVGTGNNNIWFGIYLISTTLGFIAVVYLLNVFYINPKDLSLGWYHGLLFVICMVVSVLIFGGLVVGIWHLSERKMNGEDHQIIEHNEIEHPTADKDCLSQDLYTSTTIRYGSRPDLQEIFESISERWGHVDVGVIVCGPPALESSVAKECRSLNLMRTKHYRPIFHFHSHSFSL